MSTRRRFMKIAGAAAASTAIPRFAAAQGAYPRQQPTVRASRSGAHNGGKWQLNPNYPYAGDDFPFANLLKQGSDIRENDYSNVSPDKLSPLGYALPGEFVRHPIVIPPQSYLPGNYRLRWTGTATVGISVPHTVVGGSLTGTDGEAMLALPGTDFGLFYTGDAINPISDLSLVHENYTGSYDGGDIWNPRYIERLMECRPGMIRFLNWINPNNAIGRWEHRKPLGYSIWGEGEFRGSIYVTTTNVGDAFTTSGSGGTLTHGEVAIVRLSATPGASPTLNWKGTGAKPLRALSNLGLGTLFDAPLGGYYYTCVYDSYFDAWLLDGGGGISCAMKNAVPVEVCMDLCNRVGAHCWIPIPFIATDPLTDYAPSLATLAKATLHTGLKLFVEPGMSAGTPSISTPTHGGRSTEGCISGALFTTGRSRGTHAFYNQMSAQVGHAVSDVYAGDRSRYAMVSAGQGVAYYLQTVGDSYLENLFRYNSRVKGENYHTDSGEYAKAWVTHISCSNYWGAARESTPEETTLNTEYATATPTRKAEILNDYLLGPEDSPGVFRQYSGLGPLNTKAWTVLAWHAAHCYATWAQIASDNGHGFVAYEGGLWTDGTVGLDARIKGTAARDLTRFDFQNWLDAGGTFPSQYWLASPLWNLGLLSPNIYGPDTPAYLGVLDFNNAAKSGRKPRA